MNTFIAVYNIIKYLGHSDVRIVIGLIEEAPNGMLSIFLAYYQDTV